MTSTDAKRECIDLCREALAHHQSNRFQKAAELYSKAIEKDPTNPDPLHLLGRLLDQNGHPEHAVALIQSAIGIDDTRPEYFDDLGIAYRSHGNLPDAALAHEKAILLDPQFTSARHNLAVVYQELNRHEDAINAYRASLKAHPKSLSSATNLSALLIQLGRPLEALPVIESARHIFPNDAGLMCNLGLVRKAQGLIDEAIELFQTVATHQLPPSQLSKVESNLANALAEKGRFDEALPIYLMACHRADVQEQGEVLVNLGVLYLQMGMHTQAAAALLRAVGKVPAAQMKYLTSLCYGENEVYSDLFFSHHIALAPRFPKAMTSPAPKPLTGRKLRVGYVSSDFRGHPVGQNIHALFEHRDRDNTEIYCYSELATGDAMTRFFEGQADAFHKTVGLSDAAVAEMIRRDNIDVLVFLAGHFDGNRTAIAVHHPAPLQVSFHDIATSGMSDIDAFVTDGILHPADTTEPFTETLYRLPAFYNRRPLVPGDTTVTPLPFATNGHITFGAFNNPSKTTADTIELWARVLQAVPDARLVFKYKNWYQNAVITDPIKAIFERQGIAPNRIEWHTTGTEVADYHKAYGQVDMLLDSFPFTGATTTFDALCMGVPVITQAGKTFRSRYSAAILHHAGCADWVAESPEAFVTLAKTHASSPAKLESLRQSLPHQVATSPLCDGPTYAKTVEAIYRDMWLEKFPG